MMRSATAFLPDSMMTFMNLDRSTEPYFGSGRISRLGTSRRRGMKTSFLRISAGRLHCRRPRPTIRVGHLLRPLHPRKRLERPSRAGRSAGPGAQPYCCTASPAAGDPAHAAGRSGLFRTLGAVLLARLLAVLYTLQVERAAHDVVAHAGQILDPAAAHQHDAVLLQVVALAADVLDDLEAVGQAHLGDLAQRRVRLLRRRRVDARAHPAALRTVLHRRRLALDRLDLAALAHELVDGWHDGLVSYRFRRPGRGRGRAPPSLRRRLGSVCHRMTPVRAPKSFPLYAFADCLRGGNVSPAGAAAAGPAKTPTPDRRTPRRRRHPPPPAAPPPALRPPAARSRGARSRPCPPWPCAPGGRPSRCPPGSAGRRSRSPSGRAARRACP